MPKWEYIGDGVYASFDGYHVILITCTGDPNFPDNKIFLDRHVVSSFQAYIERLKRKESEQTDEQQTT